MKIICFGDSNTYGYNPRSRLGGRHDADSHWVDILAGETGWTVCNMGQNGREIPEAAPAFPEDTDLLVIMLGTNDLLDTVPNTPLGSWSASSLELIYLGTSSC